MEGRRECTVVEENHLYSQLVVATPSERPDDCELPNSRTLFRMRMLHHCMSELRRLSAVMVERHICLQQPGYRFDFYFYVEVEEGVLHSNHPNYRQTRTQAQFDRGETCLQIRTGYSLIGVGGVRMSWWATDAWTETPSV